MDSENSSQKNKNVVELPDDHLLENAKKRFNTLHSSIYGEISSMLSKAKIMPMPDLMMQNPSFTRLVQILKEFREPLSILAPMLEIDDELPMLDEYISLAEKLADAIESESHDNLCGVIAALDEKPYI
jgi:prephenate dehydrogenase